jgi:hypothetical protein
MLAPFSNAAELGASGSKKGELVMVLLLIILLVLMVGGLPAWPYSRSWGYYPSGGLGLVLLVLLVLLLMGRL